MSHLYRASENPILTSFHDRRFIISGPHQPLDHFLITRQLIPTCRPRRSSCLFACHRVTFLNAPDSSLSSSGGVDRPTVLTFDNCVTDLHSRSSWMLATWQGPSVLQYEKDRPTQPFFSLPEIQKSLSSSSSPSFS
ncbi:hypothetical protein TIFTF001_005506 [Ficus carica]|uniref:Uncharacterized protein n=1 Tax=Ficus carica TaxID=3494 RepID=A0AA87ZGC5_FICCA|nr:hypothetical protein TIFTF001_005506 [Ficus carica]